MDLKLKQDMRFAYGEPTGIAPGIVRLVANNPSPFTFKGTNTYLVGSTSLAVIDPGPDDPEHRDAILKTADGRAITHILTTHAHRDHIDGAAALAKQTGAVTCAFPRRSDDEMDAQIRPTGEAFINYETTPDHVLTDGQRIEGADWKLDAIHTPGHAPDHMCFRLADRGVVFSGDHVMAWNTTVIAPPEGHMGDYFTSLERLLVGEDTLYLPGHGGRLEQPVRMVKAYMVHRRWREQAILGAIRDGIPNIKAIVTLIYKDIDDKLRIAASLSVQAHVEHLIEKGFLTAQNQFSGSGPSKSRIDFDTALEATPASP
ncbi:MAG: MBL fold metallo-hydrolase [Pseudomonadota bacterium]